MIVNIQYTNGAYPWKWQVIDENTVLGRGWCATARGAKRKGKRVAKALLNKAFEVK